jgi:hypothetical protein
VTTADMMRVVWLRGEPWNALAVAACPHAG